jgi:hypothetical protein
MNMNQVKIQEQENKTLDKDRIIAASKRVRRTSNRRIWCVQLQSENPKTSVITSLKLPCIL